MLLGNGHEQAFELNNVPKFVLQPDVEGRQLCHTISGLAKAHGLENTILETNVDLVTITVSFLSC